MVVEAAGSLWWTVPTVTPIDNGSRYCVRVPIDHPPLLPAPAPPGALLQFCCAAVGHDGVPLLCGVDLDATAGECLAVTGPNGAGKTTLVRAALGLADVVGGEVRIGTRRIGYVPQRHSVAPVVSATAAEVVAVGRLTLSGPIGRWAPSARRRDRDAVARALESVGLAGVASASVARLSGGQQRRVLVARALAAEPRLLFLDEPTAGVDAASRQVLAGVLHRLREDGVAIVVVTHEPDALAEVVTRHVVVTGGRVVEGALR